MPVYIVPKNEYGNQERSRTLKESWKASTSRLLCNIKENDFTRSWKNLTSYNVLSMLPRKTQHSNFVKHVTEACH